jgi:hypothetical protein
MYGEHAAVSLDDSDKPDENKVNDWNANVYSYHFVDKDEETQQAVQKMNQNTKKVNDWDANVYSYHFVDQDQQTEEAVKNMNKNAKLETNGNDWNANVYSYPSKPRRRHRPQTGGGAVSVSDSGRSTLFKM